MRSMWMQLLIAATIACGFVAGSPSALAEEITAEKLRDNYRAQFEKLAQEWEQKGNHLVAYNLRNWLPPNKNRQILYLTEPNSVRWPTNDPKAVDTRSESVAASFFAGGERLVNHFIAIGETGKISGKYADDLFDRAVAEFDKPTPDETFVYQALHEVIRSNDGHVAARKILGHREGPGFDWLTEFNAPISSRTATLDHPNLGWKRDKHWRYESTHFHLTTDQPGDAGTKIVQELEFLYSAWRQIFFEHLARPGALAARVKGGNEPLFNRAKQHRVVLFRNRAEYVAVLGRTTPRIELTTGLYYDRDQTSYFYLSNEQDRLPVAARYHEVVHQLLQENLGGRLTPGDDANFWAVEGIATYFESLAFGPGYVTLGGWEADRLQFARYRTLSGNKSWPLAQLLSVGKDQWQQHADIRQLYARSAAMTQFLLDGNDGKHRPALLNLVSTIYRQQDKPDSLTKLTQVSPDNLDEQFQSFLQVTDADLDFLLQPKRLRNLSLGLTSITDASLAKLQPCTQLEWLDLTGTQITDQGLQVITHMPQLKQLFLERTQGTTATLALIGKLQNLEELDLTGWQLANDDLRLLTGLKNLEILYLTHTPLDDAALVHLKLLPKLKMVETTGTNITLAGKKKIGLAE